ncbi:MAG: type VI secretion system domain-containing protein [Gammaproteobacteria bacterium]
MPLLSQDWLTSLSNITAPGESLKYDEAYVELKNGMSQVSFNVEEMINVASCLLQRSYDWQLCQFLLLACAAGGYVDDFLLAMRAYDSVLSKGEAAYPQTTKGRQAALYWLNQSSIVELLQQHKEQLSESWLIACKETWTKLQASWKSSFESEHLSWHVLGKWLEQARPATAAPEKKRDATVIPVVPVNPAIEDDRQASEQLERLWEYYWKKGNKLKAMCLSRSDAWARTVMPQEQFGKTWVAPLRPVDHQHMHALYSQGQWESLWECAEQCFMQQGGPFDLRLQHYIIQSIEHLNKPDILIWAKGFFMAWLDAYPELLDMHFNDGTPFCDASVRGWVSSLKSPISIEADKSEVNLFDSTEAGIRKRKKEAVDWLKAFVPVSHADKIWQRYLCVLNDFVNQRSDSAWRGYQALETFCEEKELFYWDSKLMKKIWTLGVEMSERKGVRYEHILNQIIQHDFLFAGDIA